MTERLPLSATSTDLVERALLRSVRRDHPGPHAMQRTAAALGLGASAFAATASSSGALASSSAAVSLPWLAVKAVVIGVLCGTGVLVGANAVTAPASQHEHRTDVAAQREHRADVAASSVVIARAPVASNAPSVPKAQSESNAVSVVEHEPIALGRASVGVAPLAAAERPRGDVALAGSSLSRPHLQEPEPATAGAESSATVDDRGPSHDVEPAKGFGLASQTDAAFAPEPARSRSAPSSMGEEIAAIDRVRQLLQQGDAPAALGELERYQARWPSGVFALESVVLRVQAMLVRGDRAAAERAAGSVLESQPDGRYAARLRALLGSSKSSDPNPASSTRKGS